MVTRPSGRDALVSEWGAACCAPEFTLTALLDAAIHATIDHSRLRSQRLLEPRAEVGSFAKNLPGFDVVFHHCRHAVLLDRADLHADPTAQVARHDRAAALEDQFVLFHAAVPDFLWHQGAAGAAVHADLADLAEFVDAVVNRLVMGHICVGEDDLQPRP
jgi:hypothetical protein